MRSFRIVLAVALLPLASLRAQSDRSSPSSPSSPSRSSSHARAAHGPATADTTRYVVLFSGRPAGFLKASSAGDERRYEFEYNDRGRGPHLEQRVVLGANGIPSFAEVRGHGYFKNAVDERFRYEKGVARWKNDVEGDTSVRSTPRFYSSVNGTPGEGLLLARALLAAPGHKVALFPAGEARIEKVGELEVATKGGRRTVTQYAISGLALTPTYIWLDRDGERFATVSSWSSVVPEGWESAVPSMLKAQESARTSLFEQLAKRLAHHAKGAVVIKNASVFDAESATLRPRTTVVVAGDRIQAVGRDDSVVTPSGAQVIDAGGKTLLPGLWDMHVHLSPGEEGILHLAAGVTTVRDMGNDTTTVLDLRRKYNAGTLLGPRVVMAGLIDLPGPYQVPTGVLASTEPEVRAAVDRYAQLGFEQIKVYSSMKPELVPAIVDEAHKHGLRVSGHVPAYMTAEQVVKLGFDEVQHANMLMLNFMDSVKDTRSMARFTAVAEHGAELDLQSDRVRQFIQLFKDRNVVIDPTLGTFEDMFKGRPGKLSSSFGMVASRFPPQVRRGFYGGGLPVPDGKDQRYRDSYQAMLNMVAAMHRAGVRIVAGTDGLAGFLLHRELELYVQAGIPAPDVLRIATLGAARVMKHEDERGSIAPGKLADLIIVNGDPTTNISNIRQVDLVMKGGTIFRPAELYGALGITP